MGLGGGDIPCVGRIVAPADILHARTGNRLYKRTSLLEETFEVGRGESGWHFDPDVVEELLASAAEIRAVCDGTNLEPPMRRRRYDEGPSGGR